MDTEIVSSADVKPLIKLCSSRHDLSELFHYEIYNQGLTNRCIASATITALEYLRQLDGKEYKKLSVLYEYSHALRILNLEDKDSCITFRSAIESLSKYGCTYDGVSDEESGISNFISDTKVYQISVNKDVFRVKLGLDNIPIIVIVSCDHKSFQMPIMQGHTIKKISHAICIVGYDDEEETFKFQNSYGEEYGIGGFGKLHYSFLNNVVVAMSFNKSCIKGDLGDFT